MLTVLWFIIVGAVIGALARLLVPGSNPIGILLTIGVGIIGAILGGVIASALGAGSVIAFIFAVAIAAIGVVALTSHGSGRWGSGRFGRRRRSYF
ncbi:GlsB/YeaQ/YmgE family stress response membrane protein [Spirillospora sp. NPDC049652]